MINLGSDDEKFGFGLKILISFNLFNPGSDKIEDKI
jgi:hypothetical protein